MSLPQFILTFSQSTLNLILFILIISHWMNLHLAIPQSLQFNDHWEIYQTGQLMQGWGLTHLQKLKGKIGRLVSFKVEKAYLNADLFILICSHSMAFWWISQCNQVDFSSDQQIFCPNHLHTQKYNPRVKEIKHLSMKMLILSSLLLITSVWVLKFSYWEMFEHSQAYIHWANESLGNYTIYSILRIPYSFMKYPTEI